MVHGVSMVGEARNEIRNEVSTHSNSNSQDLKVKRIMFLVWLAKTRLCLAMKLGYEQKHIYDTDMEIWLNWKT